MRSIRRFAREVAERFQPEKIILVGSYAYGTPHENSDVDILVIMPARSMSEQAVRIRMAIDAPFAMDLLVRTPQFIQRREKLDDSFLKDVFTRGKLLYAKKDAGMGSQGGERLRRGTAYEVPEPRCD